MKEQHAVALVIAALVLLFVLTRNVKAKALASSAFLPYSNPIIAASNTFGVPAARIAAIIMVESALNPNAIGSIGERGLMQLTRGALSDVNARFKTTYTFDQLFTPETNIAVGAAYLSILFKQTGNWNDATRCYNVGFGNWTKNRQAGQEYLNRVLAAEQETNNLF